jgi:hypothetical protein
MNRVLIATACCLGSCVTPTASTAVVEGDLMVLAASVRMLERRLETCEDRIDGLAATRPGPAPVAETRPTPMPPARSVPPDDETPQHKGPDPIRTLAEEVARLRAQLRPNPSSNRPVERPAAVRATRLRSPPPVTPQPRPQPRPRPTPSGREGEAPRGRFQLAGVGKTAWQTVLDTQTGVIFNYRMVAGRAVWIPITTPVPVASPRR